MAAVAGDCAAEGLSSIAVVIVGVMEAAEAAALVETRGGDDSCTMVTDPVVAVGGRERVRTTLLVISGCSGAKQTADKQTADGGQREMGNSRGRHWRGEAQSRGFFYRFSQGGTWWWFQHWPPRGTP